MYWSSQRPLWCGSILCLLCSLGLWSAAEAQARRGVPASTAPSSAAPARAPQPLSQNTQITLDQNGLSVDAQDQDLPAIVERIATLGQIAIAHPEGIPNRRVSIRFSSLPVVDGLKRLFRIAEVPGYVLVTARNGIQVQRIVFLAEEGTGGVGAGRGNLRAPQVATAQPPPPPPRPASAAPPPPAPPPAQEEPKREEGTSGGTVFDDIKSNAAARRLLSQMMHPNEQVRERAFEGLVRLVGEDEKQRALMEFLEPLMEDLGAEEKATQDEAREEIRKLLTR